MTTTTRICAKVTGFVSRYRAQRPSGDVADTHASLTDEPGSRPDEGNLLYRPDGAASGAVAQPYGELPWLAR